MHDLSPIAVWISRFATLRVAIALLATLVFTSCARWLRGVSGSGAWAGAVVCFLLYTSVGRGAFAALISLFILTWTATRFGQSRKQKLGTAEKGGRTASQVLANLGVAAIAAVLFAVYGNAAFISAMAAALAEASADTVSSEIGQAVGSVPRLITTWKTVPAGTDGGVTIVGTLAGIIAAGISSAVFGATGLVSWRLSGLIVGAAVAGMIADSFLGAWWERRGILNNELVNFLGTMVAAGIALLVVWCFRGAAL
jgi:uncharacterized protein (TIGR00297 family)